MKWGVIGTARRDGEQLATWSVRVFDEKTDADEFARGLTRLARRGLGGGGQKFLKQLMEQDHGVREVPVTLDFIKYTALPFAEEFEAPHEEGILILPPPPVVMPIAEHSTEESFYMGVEVPAGEDGGYIAIGHNEEGWWVSLTIDSDTAGFVDDAFTDDGPFPTALEALESGVDAMLSWASENDLYDAIERPMREDMIDHIEHTIGVDLPEYNV